MEVDLNLVDNGTSILFNTKPLCSKFNQLGCKRCLQNDHCLWCPESQTCSFKSSNLLQECHEKDCPDKKYYRIDHFYDQTKSDQFWKTKSLGQCYQKWREVAKRQLFGLGYFANGDFSQKYGDFLKIFLATLI